MSIQRIILTDIDEGYAPPPVVLDLSLVRKGGSLTHDTVHIAICQYNETFTKFEAEVWGGKREASGVSRIALDYHELMNALRVLYDYS